MMMKTRTIGSMLLLLFVIACGNDKPERYGPMITADMLPGKDGQNINGPSVIKAPEWLPNRLGNYYLYFAHHQGKYIRLAYADTITGPWKIYEPGSLSLQETPLLVKHIASPDVHVDEPNKRIVMYFHGPAAGTTKKGKDNEEQQTFVATSMDGIGFSPVGEAMGPSYSRVFQHDGWFYAILGSGEQKLYRANNFLTGWEKGSVVMPRKNKQDPYVRHVALRKINNNVLEVYYSRKGDAPERILRGTMDLSADWNTWMVKGEEEILAPETSYEGADLPITASRKGSSDDAEHALRDPCIYEERGKTWLFYTTAGEDGIALAELKK